MIPEPDLKDPEYVAFATLWNDLAWANTTNHHIRFSVRQTMAEQMWEMGYRPTPKRIEAGIVRQRRDLHQERERNSRNTETTNEGGQ